jgi:hypothetical protein
MGNVSTKTYSPSPKFWKLRTRQFPSSVLSSASENMWWRSLATTTWWLIRVSTILGDSTFQLTNGSENTWKRKEGVPALLNQHPKKTSVVCRLDVCLAFEKSGEEERNQKSSRCPIELFSLSLFIYYQILQYPLLHSWTHSLNNIQLIKNGSFPPQFKMIKDYIKNNPNYRVATM